MAQDIVSAQSLIGQVFGRWTVVSVHPGKTKKLGFNLRVRCICGNEKIVKKSMIVSGKSKSCGCLYREFHAGRRVQDSDLVGKRFGRWMVVELISERTTKRGLQFTARCDCGTVRTVSKRLLITGESQSCGCVSDELGAQKRIKHGYARRGRHIPEFDIWNAIIQRCTNPNNAAWDDYGGRGISVCERWLKFENFIADVGHRPSAKHSIDRYPDNDGNYEPGNVRWATTGEQLRNKRSNQFIDFNGERMCIADWALRTGIPFGVLRHRFVRRKWSAEKTLTTPVGNFGPKRRK